MGAINYQVTHKKSGAKMLFKYCLKGFLKGYSTEMKMTHNTVSFFKQKFPFMHSDLQYFKDHKDFSIGKIETDLSFKNFWDTYAHKVGNKQRAEKLWIALSDNDKAKAIIYIKTYNNYLIAAQSIQKLYPETYLHQQRFNNE